MAKVTIETSTLSSIGSAIRGKEGSTELIPTTDMATRITNLPSGGGSCEYPTEYALLGNIYHDLGGKQSLAFTPNRNNFWFMANFIKAKFTISKDRYGDYPSDLGGLQYETAQVKDLSNVEFEYVDAPAQGFYRMVTFDSFANLEKLPKIIGGTLNADNYTNQIFRGLNRVREIPDNYFDNWTTSGGIRGILGFNYLLKKLPHVFYDESKPLVFKGACMNQYLYQFNSMISLETVPLIYCEDTTSTSLTSNCIPTTYDYLNLKHFTFTAPKKTPLVNKPSCKNQCIDFSGAGMIRERSIQNYHNITDGLTLVNDDVSYQAHKDKDDWYTTDINYSKYNYTSALETINTIVEVQQGNQNTIKFNKIAGSKTDGGAIGNLTPEEIAVASAKGWTVSYI